MPQHTVLLTGDVMLGRGIDQILAHPGDPTLYEEWARSADRYVELAVARNGPIPAPVAPDYVWGDAFPILRHPGVSARIINLETAVTDRGDPWPGKAIHYRMNPANLDSISTAGIDCCVLANNHTLDWSHVGLEQTLGSLKEAGVAVAGAGRNGEQAGSPCLIELPGGGRVVLVARGSVSSGIPSSWRAETDRGGVAMTEPSPAVAVATDESDSLFTLAGRLYAQRRYSEAIPLYLRVIELDSTNGNAYALLGGSYFQLGDYPQAIGAFERAIQLDEGIKLAYLGLVSANYLTQRVADAQQWMLRLIPILTGEEKDRYMATLSSQFPGLQLPGS